MASEPTLDDANEILATMAGLLLDRVNSDVGEGKWRSAIIDVRAPPGGGSYINTVRVMLLDQTVNSAIHAPVEMRRLFIPLWRMKDKVYDDEWYGFKMTVSPDGICEADFNYEPDCINDKSFFDFDEKEC